MARLKPRVNGKPNNVLAVLRQRLGLSLKQFAATIGRTAPLICNIENRKRRLTFQVAGEIWDRHEITLKKLGYTREDLHSDPR